MIKNEKILENLERLINKIKTKIDTKMVNNCYHYIEMITNEHQDPLEGIHTLF